MSFCLNCNCKIDSGRKRCKPCAEAHHKLDTSEKRRQKTTAQYGWGEDRPCQDCGVLFMQDHRYSTGPRRKRCDGCRAYKPVQNVCSRCHVQMVSGTNRYCLSCKPAAKKEGQERRLQAKQNARRALIESWPLCSICSVTHVKTGSVCFPCGKVIRRREAGRLRCFRERLFTTLVHDSADVEILLQLLDSPCEYCGSKENITIEHRIPLIRGGRHDKSNLTSACWTCNTSKGGKTFEEWKNVKPS